MKKLKFKVTAKVTKIIEVEVEDDGLSQDEIEEKGREQAHESFSVLCDGDEESYDEDSVIVTD